MHRGNKDAMIIIILVHASCEILAYALLDFLMPYNYATFPVL